MNVWLALAIILVLVIVNALFAMGEMALVSARKGRLAELAEHDAPGAARALGLSADPQRFLPTVQVGITLVSVLEGSFGGDQLAGKLRPLLARIPALEPIAGGLALTIVVIAITFVMLVLGELVPKQLALRRPEAIASRLSALLGVVSRLALPMVWVLRKASTAVLRMVGVHELTREAMTEEELRALLVESAQAGVLEHEEREMIERVLRLADRSVRAIMTPRNELVWIDIAAPRHELVAALTDNVHSRLVVCEGGPDNPVGVLRSRDVLDCILTGGEPSAAALLKHAVVLPDTISALDALERIRDDQIGLALVLDEYGSFEGIVTPADLLEAIVVDGVEQNVGVAGEPGQPDELMLDGMTPVDEVKDRLRLPELPAAGSYHTLAGLVLALLKRVPAVGDKIAFAGWLFEVTEMEGRRVNRVRASRQTLAEG